jgi:hypothetical protein
MFWNMWVGALRLFSSTCSKPSVIRLQIIRIKIWKILFTVEYVLSRVCVTVDGVRIGEWIYWPLIQTTRTAGNYSTTANDHNSQITTAPVKHFPACCDCTSRSPITAYNSGDSSASALKSFLHSLLGTTRADNTVHARVLTVSAGTCLPSQSLAAAVCSCFLRLCCLATDIVHLSVSRPSPRSECSFRAVR